MNRMTNGLNAGESANGQAASVQSANGTPPVKQDTRQNNSRPYLKRMNARLLLVRDLCVLLIISDRAAARLTPSERLQEEDDEYDRGGEEDEYYTYLSVCKNETGINLYAVYQRECDFDNQVALGRFRNAVNETGWGVFEVETSGDYDDATQAYAAGVAEGWA
uniref:Phospholipase B-like n=1 Tax=Parascaris univalens TaxID=6257 RepID=A0A914ZVV6_PARUN